MDLEKKQEFYKHVEKLIDEAEQNGQVGELELYEDIDPNEVLDKMEEDDYEEPAIDEGISKIVYKKR